ncbi:hypothetical protein HK102_011920, partial [Quaeritorhiza haematococci]
ITSMGTSAEPFTTSAPAESAPTTTPPHQRRNPTPAPTRSPTTVTTPSQPPLKE